LPSRNFFNEPAHFAVADKSDFHQQYSLPGRVETKSGFSPTD